MKTKRFHISNLGKFSGGLHTDSNGYVTVHDSPRYEQAREDQLRTWVDTGRTLTIRNAAQSEINQRSLDLWQKGGSDE